MTRTEYYCPHCKNKDPISSSSDSCPACQRELPAPNVRAASSEEEVTKLQERVKRAEEETFARGCRAILEDFATAVAGSKTVVCRPLTEIKSLLSNPLSVYQSYYKQIGSKMRLPENNEYDRHRHAVDALFFPGYADEIVFGALSLDGIGVIKFGPHSMVLKDEMINHRATVFERNTIEFAHDNKLPVAEPIPSGYRTTWNKRHDLSKAKLYSKLDDTTTPEDYPGILLEQSSGMNSDDFVEVHIYKGFNRAAIAQVTLGAGSSAEDRLIIRSIKKAVEESEVELQER